MSNINITAPLVGGDINSLVFNGREYSLKKAQKLTVEVESGKLTTMTIVYLPDAPEIDEEGSKHYRNAIRKFREFQQQCAFCHFYQSDR